MYIGYAAWFFQLIEDFFPRRIQVTINELQNVTKWRNIFAWSPDEESKFFSELEMRNLLRIDRHMDPWIITIKTSAKNLLQDIYSEIL